MRGEKCVKRDYSGAMSEDGKCSGYISECPKTEFWILGSKKGVNPTSQTHSPYATPDALDLDGAMESRGAF
jgi:hypothetical protein